MKNLLRHLAFALMVGGVNAQSNLPACQGNVFLWNDCFGTDIHSDTYRYVGEFKNGKASGQGFEIDTGNKYVGEFRSGKRNGLGTLYSSIGSVINQGLWANGYFVSSSPVQQTTSPNSEIKKQSNLPACQGANISNWSKCFGTARLDGGHEYTGEWLDGKFSGAGTYIFSFGTKYVGNWKDGKYNGEGTITSSFGSIVSQGYFVDGNIVKTNQLQKVNLSQCPTSSYFYDWNNCFGAHTFPNGSKYVGEYKSGKFDGYGTLYSRDGAVLREGKWSESLFIGPLDNRESSLAQTELETQLRLSQQPVTQQSSPSNISPRNSKRIALVIGNANYASAPLKNPLNDAADISASLKQSGFEVIDQRNATLQEMTRGIREFGDKLLKSDVGLVYYSGHGLEVKGRNYLLPVNASMIREDEIAFQAIDANLILEKMNTAKKSVNILIVDACRDNPFARSFRSVNRGLAQMDAPTGTIVSFSTSPGKTASDGDGRNSPFTKNLVKAMMRADMPIEAMFKEVRKSVVEETKGQQTPWESSSLIGDFYFKVSK